MWLFPRRAADGSLLIHLLNLDYSPEGDRVSPRSDLAVTLPDYGSTIAPTANVYAYDAEPVSVPIHRANGMISLTVPELRIWAVLVVAP